MQLLFCDHCKQEIEIPTDRDRNVEVVHLRVSDRSRGYDDPDHDRLGRALDLHRQCYIDHYQPVVDQALEARTDRDGEVFSSDL